MIVYQHKRLDNGSVFYVGIGTEKRAYSTLSRNPHWKSVVSKAGFAVDILLKDISKDEACAWEKYLISLYGRTDYNSGTLVNKTDGGDGMFNPSDEVREKKRIAMTGRSHSQQTKNKIRESLRGVISGKNNPNWGKFGPDHNRYGIERPDLSERNSKKVIDTITGIIYSSCKEAAIQTGVKYSRLKDQLNGTTKNKTTLIYLEKHCTKVNE